MSTVKLFDVRWVSHTAGPSPIKTKFGSNARTELFFMGCKKAVEGNPCKNCFNPLLWKTIKGSRELDPKEMAQHINKFAPQKYITIVGGEPFDQQEGLTELCEELRKLDFHIIVFTHYSLQETFNDWKRYQSEQESKESSIKRVNDVPDIIEGWNFNLFLRFLQSIDILVDGEYEEDKRIYDESLKDGFHDAVGSYNQVIWDLRSWREINFSDVIKGQISDNILQMAIRESDNNLVFITKNDHYKVFPLIINGKS